MGLSSLQINEYKNLKETNKGFQRKQTLDIEPYNIKQHLNGLK